MAYTHGNNSPRFAMKIFPQQQAVKQVFSNLDIKLSAKKSPFYEKSACLRALSSYNTNVLFT